VLVGSSHFYVFINLLKPDCQSDLPEEITWEFAQREIAQVKGYVTADTGLSAGWLVGFTLLTAAL